MLRKLFRLFIGAAITFAMVAAAAWIVVAMSGGDRIARDVAGVTPATAALAPGTSRRLRGGASNPYFVNRIEAATQLWRSGKIRYLIVSGNQSGGGRENCGAPAAQRKYSS